jgi:type VI secretion system protein ImpE
MTASELFQAGQLQTAIDAQLAKVKSKPTDQGARLFLFELFLFAGELDRARKQLDVLKYEDPKHLAAIEQFRTLLQSETIRREVFAGTMQPKWLMEVPPHVPTRLEAVKLLGQGRTAEARAKLDEANAAVPNIAGTLNGKKFEGLYDADERFGTVIEVFGAGGTYAWVPLETVESITMNPPGRPLDVLYRPANLVLRDGPSGDIMIPSLYPGSHLAADEELKLGRSTAFAEGEFVTGTGVKQFLAGDDPIDFHTFREIMVDA